MQERYRSSDLLRAPGFKQFFDGVSSEHTAYLTEPYSNPRFPGDRGRLTVSADRIARARALRRRARPRGAHPRNRRRGDPRGPRYLRGGAPALRAAAVRAQHSRAPREPAARGYSTACAILDVVASSQPCHITLDPGGPERDLGPDRSRIMWPFATYLRRGVLQAFGTRFPHHAAGQHERAVCGGDASRPCEPLAERGLAAGRAHLRRRRAAHLHGGQRRRGPARGRARSGIAPGYLADFVALDRDVTACDPEESTDARVLATFVGGRESIPARDRASCDPWGRALRKSKCRS